MSRFPFIFPNSKLHFTVCFRQALIQCEQLKSELERQTERLEKELASQQEKRASEKEMMKNEITKEREDIASKVLKDPICYPHCRRNVCADVIDDSVGCNS